MPNLSEEETRRLDYSYANYDRPHNFVINAIYQYADRDDRQVLGLLANDWQLSGVYRWTSGRPYAIDFGFRVSAPPNLTGNDGNPTARIVLTCDPGRGWSGDPYQQFEHLVLRPAAARQRRRRVGALLRAQPADQQPRPVDLEDVHGRRSGSRFEVRLDMFNALNHTQFTGVNATANFASLTDRTITNLPYDASGNLRSERLRGHQRRRARAHAAARHPLDVLASHWGREHGSRAPVRSFFTIEQRTQAAAPSPTIRARHAVLVADPRRRGL